MKRALMLVGALLAPQPALAQAHRAQAPQTAVFAGGCFWGVEAVFEHTRGVMTAVSGYAGGSLRSPSYQQVSDGNTGHAESVRVTYDPAQVSYQQLLEIFFLVAHDPTQLNRQGPDIGRQYRSVVFYSDEGQRRAAQEMVTRLAAMSVWEGRIVTAIERLKEFYPAEAYHQHYLARHPDQPYIVFNDLPKLERLKQRYPLLYRDPGID
jgi:peptide-methionine (S)-S-oxide reductase